MQTQTIKIKDIQILYTIQKKLSTRQAITQKEQVILSELLLQLPKPDKSLSEKIPAFLPPQINVWETTDIAATLENWRALFGHLPGWDYSPFCYLVIDEDTKMLSRNVIIIAQFAPTLAHNLDQAKRGYEVWLKNDGTAKFWFPTFEDAEQYPELYNFKGSWKEAYLLLIETLKKGWPMEKFPEELRKFLPNN